MWLPIQVHPQDSSGTALQEEGIQHVIVIANYKEVPAARGGVMAGVMETTEDIEGVLERSVGDVHIYC